MAYALPHSHSTTTSSGPHGGAIQRRPPLLPTPTSTGPHQQTLRQKPQDRRQTDQRSPDLRPKTNITKHKLQLKRLNPNQRLPDKRTVFDITFTRLKAPLNNLYALPHDNGYTAVTDKNDDIEKLLTKDATEALKQINLTPVLPPDVRARRTIFVRRLDQHVTQHDSNDIKTELTRLNEGLHIHDIFKISKSVIKITCQDSLTAQRIQTNGLLAYNTRISPQQCEQEVFVPLLTCFKCYKTDDHQTKDCLQDFDICSECGQKGHRHTHCQDKTNQTCINCDPPNNKHRTLAIKCPYRKTATENKQRQIEQTKLDEQNKTYATIAKQAATQAATETKTEIPTPTVLQIPDTTSNIALKMKGLVMEAHVRAILLGQQFGPILTDSYKRNFDIDVTFPDVDSHKLLRIHTDGQTPLIQTIQTPPQQQQQHNNRNNNKTKT